MYHEAVREPVRADAPDRPAFETILDRVLAVAPDIRARAVATESAGRVSDETVAQLRETGLYKVMQPARFGGYEYGPSKLAQVGFALGSACGSTGWVATLQVCFGWMTGFFELQAQQEVWDDPDNLLAVSYLPTRDVERVPGGYRITGRWPWASGVDSSTWLILSMLIPNPEGPPTLAWSLVPTRDVVIDHDSWRVAGLQGTGSKTVTIPQAVFVPEHRVLPLSRIMSGDVPGRAIPGNRNAAFSYPTFGPTALVSPIVGMAQGAVDAFTKIAAGATRMARPGVFVKVAESALVQRLVGECAARMDAVRSVMLSSLEEGERVIEGGGTPDQELRVRIRRNHGFAGRTAAEVTHTVFHKSGAAAADLGYEVQRFWRDANTAALHSSIDADMLYEMYGTDRLGLQPVGIF